MQLGIAGPQGDRQTLRFDNEEQLREFQRDHEQALVNEGWRLEGVDMERRSGVERRTVARGHERRADE